MKIVPGCVLCHHPSVLSYHTCFTASIVDRVVSPAPPCRAPWSPCRCNGRALALEEASPSVGRPCGACPEAAKKKTMTENTNQRPNRKKRKLTMTKVAIMLHLDAKSTIQNKTEKNPTPPYHRYFHASATSTHRTRKRCKSSCCI